MAIQAKKEKGNNESSHCNSYPDRVTNIHSAEKKGRFHFKFCATMTTVIVHFHYLGKFVRIIFQIHIAIMANGAGTSENTVQF